MTTILQRRGDSPPDPATGPNDAAEPTAASSTFLRSLVFAVALAAALIALLTFVSLRSSRAAFAERALAATEGLAQVLQQSVGAQIERIDTALRFTSLAIVREEATGRAAEPDTIDRLLEARHALLPDVESLRVTDAAGVIRHGRGIRGAPAIELGDRDYFLKARDDPATGLLLSEPLVDRASKKWVIVLARRLNHADGSFAGIIAATLRADQLRDRIATVDLGPQGAVALRAVPSMRLIARQTARGDAVAETGGSTISETFAAAVRERPLRGTFVARTAVDGVERANAYVRVGNLPLLVVIGLGTQDYLVPWGRQALQVGALALLATLTLIGSAMLGYRGWRRALVTGEALAQQGRRNRALLVAASDGTHVLDTSGRLVELSDSFAAMLGHDREKMLGMHVSQWEARVPADQLDDWTRTFGADRRMHLETVHRRADGTLIDVDITCVGVRIEGRDLIYCSSRDITKRKRAEEALAHERSLMNSLLASLPDQIYFKDEHSRFLRINPALARRYGLASPEAAVGKSDADYFTAEHAARTAADERRIRETGEPVLDLEEQEFWPDRPPTWNLTTKMPLHDAAGRVVGTFGISRDITRRKGVEVQLQQTNERFAMASDAAGLGVWELDVRERTIACDDRLHRLYGLQRSAATEAYAVWANAVHADDRKRVDAEMRQCLNGTQDLSTEFRIVRPDGETRHLRVAARTRRDGRGEAMRLTGVTFDITQRKRVELELGETTSVLRTVLESASEVSVIAVDLGGKITLFNSGAERLLGYRREEVVGQASSLDFHDPEELRVRAAALSVEAGRKVSRGMALIDAAALGRPHEWTYLRKDGSRVEVQLTVTAMLDQRGDCFGWLGVAHDVTRQKQQEATLRAAMQQARHANLAKSQFLANMSHEIRTPLNAVIGLSYLLEQTALDTAQTAYLGKIQVASRSLLAVINDVLDLSKIEAGELTLERVPFSLRTLLDEMAGLMAVQVHARPLGFAVDLPPDLPAHVEGDAARLHQILSNLLTNAIKFTERGEVRLVVSVLSEAHGRVSLRFSVRDTGIGIEPGVQARLFMPFLQADATTTRRFGGTGLGLSIVKRLVELMGGTITLHSTPGAGSEFNVDLTFTRATGGETRPAALGADSAPRLRGVRVLVVDDSEVNLEVAERILQLQGAHVALAADGRQAVERLRSEPAAIDVVLMDVQMPELDGHQATRLIRTELGLTDLPIIALTAGALTSERALAVSVGMNDFISKPFTVPDMVAVIRRHLPAGVRVRTDVPAPPSPEVAPGPDAGGAVADAAAAPPSTAATPWPAIAGIDAADVRERLAGDAALFRKMLGTMLAEFADLAPPDTAAGDELAALARLAARLHKLRGGAGMLGARAVHAAAGAAEAACRAGDAEAATALTRTVALRLAELSEAAAPELVADSEVAPRAASGLAGPAAAAPVIDAAQWRELLVLLRAHDLDALRRFAPLAPALQAKAGTAHCERVRGLLESLRFDEAAERIEDLLN